MITPVAQRQIFQTAHVEALRQAQEVGDQVQREAAKRKAADDRLTEGMDEIHQVSHSDRIRTEERHGGRGKQEGQGHQPEEGEPPEDGAPTAEPHLDFLA